MNRSIKYGCKSLMHKKLQREQQASLKKLSLPNGLRLFHKVPVQKSLLWRAQQVNTNYSTQSMAKIRETRILMWRPTKWNLNIILNDRCYNRLVTQISHWKSHAVGRILHHRWDKKWCYPTIKVSMTRAQMFHWWQTNSSRQTPFKISKTNYVNKQVPVKSKKIFNKQTNCLRICVGKLKTRHCQGLSAKTKKIWIHVHY